MLGKTIEKCYVYRADCRNNELFTCDYLYISDLKESLKTKEITYSYSFTPNIMYADKLYYKPEVEKVCDYINKDMENYEEKLKFEPVLVEFTSIVEKVEE